MAWPLVVGALMQFISSRNTNGHENQVAMAVGISLLRSKWLLAHAPFQISNLAFTHSAFLKGRGSNQFNSIQIYSQNSTMLIMTRARKTYQKKARLDGWDTLKSISPNVNIVRKRKYWVKRKN